MRCVGLGSPSRSPDSTSAATVSSRAVNVVLPAIAAYSSRPAGSVIHSGASGRMRPSRPMIVRLGSCSSRHQMTSVRSPNVHDITMPEPLPGSAAGCATTGTSTPNSGERTVVPNRCW